MQEKAFKLAYGQLRGQKEDLKHFRSQASICAAVSGLVASVFANIAFPNFNVHGLEDVLSPFGLPIAFWLIIFTFCGSILFACLAIVNWRQVTFELNPAEFLKAIDESSEVIDVEQRLARDADYYFDKNESVIDETRSYLFWSIILGVGQIPAWLCSYPYWGSQ